MSQSNHTSAPATPSIEGVLAMIGAAFAAPAASRPAVIVLPAPKAEPVDVD